MPHNDSEKKTKRQRAARLVKLTKSNILIRKRMKWSSYQCAEYRWRKKFTASLETILLWISNFFDRILHVELLRQSWIVSKVILPIGADLSPILYHCATAIKYYKKIKGRRS
jgi:hypothetical protein